ncbi:MAG: flavodoxin family protein [Acholeplasmataceae bacterium]|nr:flavodoxin family protein [Acholeplasmataceae bacterium]
MGKKALILSSSPRRGGNSDILCDQFMLGAQEAGNQAEKIFLKDKNINYCLGCGACQKTGSCVQNDDMDEILDKLVEADVIVMATPVYFYSMCAQMKTLIDRTCPVYTKISDKKFYIIATAADGSKDALDETITGFRGFFRCLDNPEEAGIIDGLGAWKIGDIKGHPAMKHAYEMGKNI